MSVRVQTGFSVRVAGPLAPYAAGAAKDLLECGYTEVSACTKMRLLSQLSTWMEQRGVGLRELTPAEAAKFMACRVQASPSGPRTIRALALILGYLRQVAGVPAPVAAAPDGPVERLVEKYRDHLVRERGLLPGTVIQYVADARLFLGQRRSSDGGLELAELNGNDVTQFALRECGRRSVGTAKLLITHLRSLLRFLHLAGEAPPLADVVPMVPGWHATGLPHAMKPDEVERMMASCAADTDAGRRDLAMLTLMVRLGLRSSEVAALELADIDWRSGELIIRGKGNCQERLPLPVDVGEAVVTYLTNGRPACSDRRLFLRVRAPIGGLTRGVVERAVWMACQRAGVKPAGAHRLRHTAATEMLRAGASLAEVSQVLRHRKPATTTIYAKVDREALREIARAWPEGVA